MKRFETDDKTAVLLTNYLGLGFYVGSGSGLVVEWVEVLNGQRDLHADRGKNKGK